MIIQSACDILIYNLNEAETVPEGEGRKRGRQRRTERTEEKSMKKHGVRIGLLSVMLVMIAALLCGCAR